jgi:L-fuconolactonase
MVSRRSFLLSSSALALSLELPRLFAEENPGFSLFDTHLHFFTADIAKYPMRPGAPDRLAANPNNVEKVLTLMDQMGVEGCAGVQYRTAYGDDDRYLLDVAAVNRRRIVPVVILDGTKPEGPDELIRLVKSKGAGGLRLTGPEAKDGSDPWLNSDTALELWKTAASLGTPVALMYQPVVMGTGWEPSLKRIGDLAGMYPKLKIVTDHIGWPVVRAPSDFGLSGMHAELKLHKNVYYKLTTLNLELAEKANVSVPEFVRALVDFYGADHILWGSDFGNSPGTYPELVARALAAVSKLSPSEKREVLHNTGRSVYSALQGV